MKRRQSSCCPKPSKKAKTESPSPDWADLPRELVREIWGSLNLVDRARAQWPCKQWRSAASGSLVDPTPWLWIPPQADEPDGIIRENSHSRLYNPADEYIHRTKAAFSGENTSSFCVGASHGYLIFVDQHISFLLNPLTGSRSPLPKIDHGSFPSLFAQPGEDPVSITKIRERFVHKAILTSDPADCESRSRFTVVLLCGDERSRQILTCAPFSDFRWAELEGADAVPYHDVSTMDGLLFALGESYSVDVWNLRRDYSDYPEKVRSLELSVPEPFPVGETDLCVSRFYIVKPKSSGGDDVMPILVARIIGEFVDGRGNVVCYDEMAPEQGSNQPPVCPYRTVGFEVYRMDADRRNWVRAANLGDEEKRALFLGGSDSVSVPAGGGIAADCIYYTDDCWDRMDEDDSYGGHDIGVFDMRDGKTRWLGDKFEEDKFNPAPFWMVPTPRPAAGELDDSDLD